MNIEIITQAFTSKRSIFILLIQITRYDLLTSSHRFLERIASSFVVTVFLVITSWTVSLTVAHLATPDALVSRQERIRLVFIWKVSDQEGNSLLKHFTNKISRETIDAKGLPNVPQFDWVWKPGQLKVHPNLQLDNTHA